MKIGIMGGTFNPVHNGHIQLALSAYEQYALDEVWFLPNGNPPHKQTEEAITAIAHRIEMVKLAIEKYDYFKLNLCEADEKVLSYSYKTMEMLTNKYPKDEFYFILGADSLFMVGTWKYSQRFFHTCTILAARRENVTLEEMQLQIQSLKDQFDLKAEPLLMPYANISSFQIREMAKNDKELSSWLDEKVLKYIKMQGLYLKKSKLPSIRDLESEVKEHITAKRFHHTQGVMYTAAALAMCHGYDVEKAMIFGLLHDCAKDISMEHQLMLCEKYKLSISDSERVAPSLLHAKLGSYFAKTHYGIDDKEILDAILYHTTGRPDMTTAEQILYIADYIEPGRKDMQILSKVRTLAFQNLEQCVYVILESTLYYLESKSETQNQQIIDLATRKAYQFYKRKRSEENGTI